MHVAVAGLAAWSIGTAWRGIGIAHGGEGGVELSTTSPCIVGCVASWIHCPTLSFNGVKTQRKLNMKYIIALLILIYTCRPIPAPPPPSSLDSILLQRRQRVYVILRPFTPHL